MDTCYPFFVLVYFINHFILCIGTDSNTTDFSTTSNITLATNMTSDVNVTVLLINDSFTEEYENTLGTYTTETVTQDPVVLHNTIMHGVTLDPGIYSVDHNNNNNNNNPNNNKKNDRISMNEQDSNNGNFKKSDNVHNNDNDDNDSTPNLIIIDVTADNDVAAETTTNRPKEYSSSSSGQSWKEESLHNHQHAYEQSHKDGRVRAFPPHAVHGLVWEDDPDYSMSVLLPIGCGVIGALGIVLLMFAVRSCQRDQTLTRFIPAPPLVQAPKSSSRDQIILLHDSSEDEEV